jgi:hypothetical protein
MRGFWQVDGNGCKQELARREEEEEEEEEERGGMWWQ